MSFCKLDVRKATINTVLQQVINSAIVNKITGRASYKLVDNNYTIELTSPNINKAKSTKAANKMAETLRNSINKHSPEILKVVIKRIEINYPIQLEVYVNPNFITKKFNDLPTKQKNNVEVNLVRDINFFNGDEALFEQEQKENEIKITNDDEIRRLGEIIFETGQDSSSNDDYRNIKFSEEFSMLGSTPRFIQAGIDIYSTDNEQRKSSVSDINRKSGYDTMLQKTLGEIWNERNSNKEQFRIYVQSYITKQINGKYRGLSERLEGNDFYKSNYRINFKSLADNTRIQALQNGTIEIDSEQFSEAISQSSDFKSVREYIDLALLEEMIHLFQMKTMIKADYDNIYNELSKEEIKNITEVYNRNKKELNKENLVDEYIRMLVQNNLTGNSSEVYLKSPKNVVLQRIYKLFRDIIDALSFKPYSKEISDKYTYEIKSSLDNTSTTNNNKFSSFIIRENINYYDEPGFKKRNPNFNPEAYVNNADKFGTGNEVELTEELTPTLTEELNNEDNYNFTNPYESNTFDLNKIKNC